MHTEARQGDVSAETQDDAVDARTLSSLAERILAADAERERAPAIDVDAMSGVRADADEVDPRDLEARPLATDDIVDDDTDAADETE